ncbi:sugar ABC transporter permease [Aeromonas salmonicida subsp. salmonicida]|uniref:ABC-type sugar transporter, permease component n=2 Tax=Aeromonas salmonicida subsp. salmonicida TaxID=29491 RepID=A4ST94_AERS4|nr:ABC transporter permease [Aeromonas salmonicida]ABO92116.1 ABC-type sugar transporter, permease component [Aeromonas salmonicida subsp. salmonicida A449]AYO65073.1 ABC transporter permease [Aeromonas salmonicida subsp. salmonicida 01-B526]EHI50765.1 ABC-type sugar transporter, permease component [Aeromonas salmonicida subsp. salmonicida 01-B526]EKP0239554.1 ABC transporter permease [Aeromonas salmonicida]EKP0243738.1 ABC transporter permease [Aeromonas salmonicida]
MFELLILMLDATIRTAPQLILAAMAGMFCERSGVVNIALEGKLLASAFTGGAAAAVSGSAWVGLGAGVGVSILFALMHGFATITHRGDQVVSGMAINILAAGLTVTLGRYWFDQGGQTPALSGAARFAPIELPYARELYDVPVIGQLYSELLSGHSLLEYVAFACVPLAWWVLFRTRFGLRLRAVGEAPAAVDTAGISVVRMRYTALIIGGLLAGIGGTYLAVAQTAQFIPNMSAGKGFMALAALVFGKWKPWSAMAACLLFGFLDAVAIRLQGVSIGDFAIPVQAIEALPYILTVFLLAGFIGKAVAPKALGTPYVKERE